MNKTTLWSSALTALAVLSAAIDVRAQDTFTNFETPQTHPIEVAKINGSELVLVCNTPDNSLEVWTATAGPRFLARIGVGMGPGTVRWNPQLQRAFVCNFDGDSVSIVQLTGTGAGLTGNLVRTTYVGDEPADIAFNANSSMALVTLSTRGQVQFVDPNMLTPFGGPVRLDADFAANNGLYGSGNLPLAVKTPRQAAWLANDRLLVLDLMGGQSVSGATLFSDLDLWRIDQPFTPGSVGNYLGGLGTTNHAFALTNNGQRMFVVGTRAQNLAASGVGNVRNLATGFVQSWLWVVDVPVAATGNMVTRAEAPAGAAPGPSGAFPSINLNRDYAVTTPALQEVASNLGVVQPTGVDLFESSGVVQRIAVAGFHSDSVAILTPNSGVVGGYVINRVSFSPPASYSVVGPRGLEFNAAGTLLFTNGRLDNTLRVVNTSTLAVTTRQLQQDPTPPHIKTGRQFLYSVRFSRGVNAPGPNTSGFVACASCHVDGRTDGLPWDLSEPASAPPILVPPALSEIVIAGSGAFPNPKGTMITQTLQGLVDYPTNESFQFLATNAPYHWRGDKFTDPSGEAFTKFNEAFVNLQGMLSLTGSGQGASGITGSEMIEFRRFILSIRHPPNPEQALDRTVTGSIPANPNVANPNVIPVSTPPGPGTFSGSAAGRALFHNYRIDLTEAKSCVDCHSLPDGSSNTITEVVGQPVESAALRNLFAREGTVHSSTMPSPLTSYPLMPMPFPGTAFVSNRGLSHDGGASTVGGTQFSINTFTANPAIFFLNMPAIVGLPIGSLTVPQLDQARAQVDALIQFVRELDTGVAPLAGFGFTVDNTLVPLNSGINQQAFDALEGQVRQANIGLGVQARSGAGTLRGFWFDPLSGYRDAAAPAAPATPRNTLLASFAGPGTVMVLQGTPLGTERRWANPTGVVAVNPVPGTAPANVILEEMAPDTFYEGITDLNLQLTGGVIGSTRWRMEHFHAGLLGTNFGVPAARRHEPPRRFRVSGTDIRPGAKMYLFMTDGTFPSGGGPATSFFPLGMELKITPTQFVSPTSANPVWESELELSPLQTYAFLNGGPFAPGVQATIDTPLGATAGPALFATTFNQYRVLILNEDGTASAITPAAPLRLRDTR